MKRKFSKILGIGLALALLTSLLVTGVPVAAQIDISDLEVTVSPNITDAGGYYKVIFQIHNGLDINTDTISVRFPDETTVPATMAAGSVKISASTVKADLDTIPEVPANLYDLGPLDPSSVTVTDQTVMMWAPFDIPAEDWIMVEFAGRTELGNCDAAANAGLMNPDIAGTYSLWACTCESPNEVEVQYGILAPPGPVDIYEKWLGELEDCGLPYFIYRDSEDTIQDAVDAARVLHDAAIPGPGNFDAVATEFVGYKLVVHDAIYFETITIDVPGLIVESMNGAGSTIIDANNLPPAYSVVGHHCAAVMINSEGVTFGGTGKGFTVKDAGVGILPGTDWSDENSDGIADVSGVYIWPNGGTYDEPQQGTNHWCRINVIGNIIYGSEGCGIRTDADPQPSNPVGGVSVYIGENTIYNNQMWGFLGDHLTSGPTWVDPGYTYMDNSTQWGNTAIVDNEFYGNGGTEMGTWVVDGQFTNDTVYPDWIDAGILIGSTVADSDPLTNCYIVGNDIHNNVHAGICLLAYTGDAAADQVVIKQNLIYNNGIFGIANKATFLGSESPTQVINVDCRHNDIYGNGYWGIKNFVVDSYFEAKENFWGELGGPSSGPAPIRHEPDQRSLALGNGDAVSHWVYYNPWLSVSYATVVGEGIRYYGSDTLTLQAGWNTLSVPLALYTSADTLTKIDGLGDFLDDMALAYAYDTAAGNWVVPPAVFDLELATGRGFYIKMNAASNFPVLYSNQLGLPAFVLAPGWNLVGSAFGIDRVDYAPSPLDQGRWAVAPPDIFNGVTVIGDDEAVMDAGVALNSIGAQASVVVSPSVPGQLVIWSEVYTGTMANNMYTGEAYWAFITGTGTVTLAGWEITPFYFTPPSIP